MRGAVTGWTDAGVIVPYVLWRRYGDATVVRENWSAMVRYLDYVEKRGTQDAQPYGDWLSYEYGADMEWLKPIRERLQLPRKRVLTMAYRVWIGRMMAEMAEALGNAAVNSFNHYAYGAVGGWMFSTMAGIRAEKPGFRKIRFTPKPDGRFGRVAASFDSPYGRIRSSWRREGTAWIWEGEVPPNATAVLELPDGSVRSLESGRHRADWSVQAVPRRPTF